MPTPALCDAPIVLVFSPAVADGALEGYGCSSYPLDLGGKTIASIRWQDPPMGPVRLHHATLQLTAERSEATPTGCETTPADLVTLHVHAPGGGSLELPPDVGFSVPSSARFFRIETHALRTGAGAPSAARIEICTRADDPPKLAGWLGLGAPVPAIRPHMTETSTGRCELSSPFHLLSAWPHMHRVGRAFHAAVVRAGAVTPLVDVPSWDFSHQATYPLDLELDAHDVIAPTCVWENPTSEYVLPGIYSSDEMCTFGLIGWPAHAGCVSALAP